MLKVMGSSPTRGSNFALEFDCMSLLCISQVSEYLSCTKHKISLRIHNQLLHVHTCIICVDVKVPSTGVSAD